MTRETGIKKMLIANRGEIAVRIQRTCRELGIATVAVFSDPDRCARHVRSADEAFPLPGALAAETYLDLEKILEIARRCGADAIHPGYGFLSENGEFARECRRRGLLFIGPDADVIEGMGSKTEARRLMVQAGVPVIPGSEPLNSVQAALDQANEIGFPVLIKAAAGGGGKGMRLVNRPEDLPPAFDACGREAQAAFGDPHLYIEKYLVNARHIEFQILGDLQGNVIHLGERDCSVQRRYQKIIEETPSPFLDDDLRERMGQAAVAAARACRYANAGTVEFMVDDEHHFYFMEMNTRLQVEHPVTEMTSGLDLVAWQIYLAEGGPLGPVPISRRGSAIECRIYAEDPWNNFLPCPGPVELLNESSGPGVRVDTGIYQGYTIPLQYDPLLAKLIVWGQDRQQAVRRMLRALDEYHILGVRTNIEYLSRIVRHPRFASGNYSTQFINRHHQEMLERKSDPDESLALATAAVLQALKADRDPSRSLSAHSRHSDWRRLNWRSWQP